MSKCLTIGDGPKELDFTSFSVIFIHLMNEMLSPLTTRRALGNTARRLNCILLRVISPCMRTSVVYCMEPMNYIIQVDFPFKLLMKCLPLLTRSRRFVMREGVGGNNGKGSKVKS